MIPFIYSETRAPTVSSVHPHHQIILFLVSLCFHVLIRTILGNIIVEHIYNVVVYCLADMKMFAYMNLSRIEQISLGCVLLLFFPSFSREDYVEGVDKRGEDMLWDGAAVASLFFRFVMSFATVDVLRKTF